MGEVIKLKNKKKIALLFTIIFVIIIAAFVALFAYNSKTGFLFSKTGVIDTGVSANSSGECVAVKYKDGIAILGEEALIGLNKKGKESFNLPIRYQTPTLTSGGRYILAYDMGGKEYMLLASGEERQKGKSGGSIITAAVNSSGYYAIAENEKGYNGKITVYNSKGKTVYTWHTSSYIITDIALSENNKRMSVAVLDTENGSNISAVLLFSFNKSENIYCPAGSENMVIDVEYTGSSVTAVGDKAAFSLSKKGAERWRIGYGERVLENYISDKNGMMLAFTNSQGTIIENYSTSGNKKSEFVEEKNIKNIDRLGSNTILNLGNNAKVINSNGKVITNAYFEKKMAKAFLISGRQRIITMTGSSVYYNVAQ